jgi:hypothetical protein
MKDLDPEGLPRAHLRGTRRVTTIPMTTTVTADLSEVDLVGRRLRYAVGVGKKAKVKEKMRVVPRVDNGHLGRVPRDGTPKATIVIVGAGVEAGGELNQGSGLKLRIKIAYKNCIFDQIRHCAYLHILDHCVND